MYVFFSAVALAGPADTFGFGAAAMGRGLGGIALTDGPVGVFVNPAGLRYVEGGNAMMGYGLFRTDLAELPPVRWDTNRDGRVDDTDAPLRVPSDYGRDDGIQVALGRPIGSRIGVALNAFVPTDSLLDISTFEPSIPTWFMYKNRQRRFELGVGFGWEQLPGLNFGGTVQVLARTIYSLDATLTGSARGAEEGDTQATELITDLSLDVHAMDITLEPAFSPMIGLLWDVGELVPAAEGLQLGATWRGAVGLPVDVEVDLQINASLDEIGDFESTTLALLAPFGLAVYDHYLPAQWGFGVAWVEPELLRVYGDARLTRWDQMPINITQVQDGEVLIPLASESTVPLEDGNPYALTLDPTWSVRAGFELSPYTWDNDRRIGTVRPIVRGGWSYEPTPLAGIGRNVAFVDTDRMVFTGGLGFEHGAPFNLIEGPVAWDAYYQHHALASGYIPVSYADPYTPGAPINTDQIAVGGRLWAAGVQWRMQY